MMKNLEVKLSHAWACRKPQFMISMMTIDIGIFEDPIACQIFSISGKTYVS
jgi:hypothetical protein